MSDPTVDQVVAALRVSLGSLVRRMRQVHGEGELSLPESSALARLERDGATTAAALAKIEQISPQSMGATLASLEKRGFIKRAADKHDGRRILLAMTARGAAALGNRRDAKTALISQTLTSHFSRAELQLLLDAAPLLERLAQAL